MVDIALLNRRSFLVASAGLAGVTQQEPEQVYGFKTAEYEIRITFEFHDRYRSDRLGFKERFSDQHFCLSAKAEQDRNCLDKFNGSIAVARYRIRPRLRLDSVLSLREYVRSIDGSERVPARAPFERSIELLHGEGSDIQLFGSDRGAESSEPDNAWCLFRQNLYLKDEPSPFLVLHWKHTLSAIRVLDMIPGDGTKPVVAGR